MDSMRGLIRTSVFASIGVLSLAADGARALARPFVKRGEDQLGEVDRLVKHWVRRGEEEGAAARGLVKDEVDRTLSTIDIATKADIAALDDKIDALAQRVGQ